MKFLLGTYTGNSLFLIIVPTTILNKIRETKAVFSSLFKHGKKDLMVTVANFAQVGRQVESV